MLHMIAGAKASLDQRTAVGEFCRLALLRMEAKDSVSHLKQMDTGRMPERIQQIIQRADPGMISAPGGSPETWGAELAYDTLAAAFLESLANASVFDTAAPFMRPTPLKTRVLSSAVAVTGYVVAEGEAKTIETLNIDNQSLEPRKAVSVVVVSNELIKLGGNIAERMLRAELQAGVATATDVSFVSGLVAKRLRSQALVIFSGTCSRLWSRSMATQTANILSQCSLPI